MRQTRSSDSEQAEEEDGGGEEGVETEVVEASLRRGMGGGRGASLSQRRESGGGRRRRRMRSRRRRRKLPSPMMVEAKVMRSGLGWEGGRRDGMGWDEVRMKKKRMEVPDYWKHACLMCTYLARGYGHVQGVGCMLSPEAEGARMADDTRFVGFGVKVYVVAQTLQLAANQRQGLREALQCAQHAQHHA